MYLISWITVGLVVGWLSGRALKGYGYGPLMDLGMGACGAVAGGFLMQSAGVTGAKGTVCRNSSGSHPWSGHGYARGGFRKRAQAVRAAIVI
jgi:uncharacterized membrane protein YeaQ/YmgE (transglycosylase-associated protein family)